MEEDSKPQRHILNGRNRRKFKEVDAGKKGERWSCIGNIS